MAHPSSLMQPHSFLCVCSWVLAKKKKKNCRRCRRCRRRSWRAPQFQLTSRAAGGEGEPEDSDPTGRPQAHQAGARRGQGASQGRDGLGSLKPFAALHTGLFSIAAPKAFVLCAVREDGGRPQAPPESKVKGQVGQTAPSGLSWEDEIAAQLAAAGVRVSAAQEAEKEGDRDNQGGSSGTPRGAQPGTPRGRGSRFGFGSRGTGSLSGVPAADPLRAPSSPRLQAPGLAFGRFTKEIKRRFNRQGTAPPE